MTFALNEEPLPLSGSLDTVQGSAGAPHQSSYMYRLLNLLETTISMGDEATISSLAAATGMPISSTSRLLKHLTDWNFLERKENGRHSAGIRSLQIAVTITARLNTIDELRRATERLVHISGESVTAGLILNDVMLIVARTDSSQTIRAVNRVGEVIPPTRSALGKAILSTLNRTRQLELLSESGEGDPKVLLSEVQEELDVALDAGYAVDEEAFTPGLRCRAVPIYDAKGLARGGLSMGGPIMRFTKDKADLAVEPLIAEAQRLSSGTEQNHGD